MLIELKKFGDILTSRESGGEAFAAFLPTLKLLTPNEEIKIDFQGVSVLTPSWADEFMRPLLQKYGKRILFINDDNPSVQAAMQFANPKLDLSQVTVFKDKLVFDEKNDNKNYGGSRALLVLTFPYDDKDALGILKDNEVEKIHVIPADALVDSPRLGDVVQMLEQAGIKTTVEKGRKIS